MLMFKHRLYRLRKPGLKTCICAILALHVTDTDLAMGEGRRKSVDSALQTSVLGVKTLHSTAE